MKLIRFSKGAEPEWGLLEGTEVFSIKGSVFDSFQKGSPVGEVHEIILRPPCTPKKIIALGYNYKDLVGFKEKYEEPLMFFKSPTSLISCLEPIRLPETIEKVWVEVELAIVIKKLTKNISKERAADHILGYTLANDVTAVNIHGRDHHLARSKGLDTFCPVGPFLETELQTDNLTLQTLINGQVTQKGTTANRILNDDEVLSLVSRFVTLEPGDLILTGTPKGATDSVVRKGDKVILSIDQLGRLENEIRSFQ